MDYLKNDYVGQLEEMLRDLLQGRSLEQWCDEISNQFIEQTGQTTPPFSLTKFLPYRRIIAEHDNSISVAGQIEKSKDNFILKINPKLAANKNYYNYVFGHEIAHTFFYDITGVEPIDISGLPVGSKYLEYLCNRIARYLLIPSRPIKKILSHNKPISDSDFSLKVISDLLQTFETTSPILLTRIIIDEPLWNCIFLRFKNFKEVTPDTWKLIDVYQPREFSSKRYFIASINKQEGVDKLHTVKGNLFHFINELKNEHVNKKRLYKKVPISSLKGDPLTTFIKNYKSKSDVIIHSSYYDREATINLMVVL